MTTKTRTKHTPGPWKASENLSGPGNHRGWTIRSGRDYIGQVYPRGSDPTPEAIANAHLIAAVPELLEALTGAVAEMATTTIWSEAYLALLRSVIARATGEQP